MDKFVADFKRYFHERKLIRWLLFTYPKSSALFATSLLSIYIYAGLRVHRATKKEKNSIEYSVHQTDSSIRRTKKILIYNAAESNE